MASHAPVPPAMERLARDLADGGAASVLAPELARWLARSSRFRVFAEANRAKVRKKLRGAADAETLRDVRAELAVARLLLGDRRLELAFEAYGSGRGGPDFTVTYRAGRPFNLEVTRLHRAPTEAALAGVVLGKLRQLPPSAPNAVLVAVEGETAEAVDVAAVVRAIRARADAKDDAFFAYRGVGGTREFFEGFLRLGGVVIWAEGGAGDERATAWSNGSARIALDERAIRTCLASLRADG